MQTLFTRNIKAVIFFSLLLIVTIANPSIVSRITTFTDGNVLTAAQLNSEFNNILNTVNNLDDDNISTTANLTPSKISASMAGAGISRDGSTGILAVNPDGVGLEISGDTVQLKNNGVTAAKFEQVAGLSLVGRSANTTGNVAAITAATDNHVLRRSGTSIGFGTLATDSIADGAITQAKRFALGAQVSSSSGGYSTASTSYVDVTNLTVTITTTGRAVWVGLISGDASTGCYVGANHTSATPSPHSMFKIVRDAADISFASVIGQVTGTVSFASTFVPCGSIFTIDTGATAASHTYKVSTKVLVGSTALVGYAKLVAYEL